MGARRGSPSGPRSSVGRTRSSRGAPSSRTRTSSTRCSPRGSAPCRDEGTLLEEPAIASAFTILGDAFPKDNLEVLKEGAAELFRLGDARRDLEAKVNEAKVPVAPVNEALLLRKRLRTLAAAGLVFWDAPTTLARFVPLRSAATKARRARSAQPELAARKLAATARGAVGCQKCSRRPSEALLAARNARGRQPLAPLAIRERRYDRPGRCWLLVKLAATVQGAAFGSKPFVLVDAFDVERPSSDERPLHPDSSRHPNGVKECLHCCLNPAVSRFWALAQALQVWPVLAQPPPAEHRNNPRSEARSGSLVGSAAPVLSLLLSLCPKPLRDSAPSTITTSSPRRSIELEAVGEKSAGTGLATTEFSSSIGKNS